MIKLIESDYIKLLPTKQEIIQRINQLCRKYGKSDVGKSLYHNLCDIGYYTEDKRKSFIQFAIDVLNNCYTDGIPYYPNDITISCEKPTPLGVGWIAGNKNLSSIAI